MKKITFRSCLIAALSLLSLNVACGQKNYEDTDVSGFATLVADPSIVLLDVRTAQEYAEGHIDGAVNVDYRQDNFLEKAKALLPANTKIAIYCRSGRRSASAAEKLAVEGFELVNLKGGIIAWKDAQKPVAVDNYEVDVFKTKSGKTLRFHALTHASIRMVYDGKEIMIDPVTKLGGKTIDYSAVSKANYLFVTHEHGDHFDKEAISRLSGEQTQLITNKRCAEMLGYGEIMANGQRSTFNDILVEAVPAYNTTEANTKFHPKGRDNGFILTVDGLRIYIAGDTEDIPEMADIKDIDIAFMPCNQPYTMTPAQLLNAAKMVKPKVLFPYHYGQTDVTGIPAQLKQEGIDVRIRHYE